MGNNTKDEVDAKYRVPWKEFYDSNKFQNKWISEGADKEMIKFAEEIAQYLVEHKLGTTKFRNFYSEVKRIQMARWQNEKSSYYLLKPKLAYSVGREQDIKIQEGIKLLQCIFANCFDLVNSNETYDNYCDLMEAILAFHKFYEEKKSNDYYGRQHSNNG